MHIATLATSVSTGHNGCPAVGAEEGCPHVKVNGSPVLLVGHKLKPHGSDSYGTHQGVIGSGSTILKVNGIPVAMVGSTIDGCNDSTIATGDSLVNIER